MRKLDLSALAVEGFATTAATSARFGAAPVNLPTLQTCPLGCTEFDCGGGSRITVCPVTQTGTA